MKIIEVNTFFSPSGGAETIAYNTYKMLKANGHDVVFFASDKKPYFDPNVDDIHNFTPYNGSIKDYLKNPVKYYYNYTAKKDFSRLITSFNPDLIHLHYFRTCLTSSILECCNDIPTVMTVHDASLVCPANKLLFKNKFMCTDLKCKHGNYYNCILNNCADNNLEGSIRKTVRSYMTFKNLKYINLFITPSDALKQIIVSGNIGIPEAKIQVLNNCLINEDIDTHTVFSNRNYFLYVGRLSKEKGVHFLLEAMKDLPKEIELHIIGKGPEEENFKQYAKKNNLDNVKFLGFKNREEIKEEYQNCIATILPCNWFENFPTTNMESFINGKPVIASNIGGIPEQVEHNKTGLLFEPTNVEQLKECILKYWNNPDLVVEHGKNANQKALDLYTEAKYYKELMNIFNSITK